VTSTRNVNWGRELVYFIKTLASTNIFQERSFLAVVLYTLKELATALIVPIFLFDLNSIPAPPTFQI
jgi:hypothetical protein